MDKRRIALTMGDPAGVGPEICLRALADEQLAAECQLIVFGDAGVLNRCADQLGLPDSAEHRPTRRSTAYNPQELCCGSRADRRAEANDWVRIRGVR